MIKVYATTNDGAYVEKDTFYLNGYRLRWAKSKQERVRVTKRSRRWERIRHSLMDNIKRTDVEWNRIRGKQRRIDPTGHEDV